MNYEYKKADDCFSDAENFEYRLGVMGAEFIDSLEEAGHAVHINSKLRRPTFTSTWANGIQLKGLLERNVIKVGFVPEAFEAQKSAFDTWLGEL